jgi:DNA-binding LytR/AlgR family response regulator
MNLINTNLSEDLSQIIYDYLNYTKRLTNNDFTLCLHHMQDLSTPAKLSLRKVINKYPGARLVLLSDSPDVSFFAWKLNVFYFLTLPIEESSLSVLRQRLLQSSNERRDEEKIKMNYKGGFDLWHPEEICVLKGEGSYCKFYFRTEKPRIYTARISNIAESLLDSAYMIHVNKSLIININHLTGIKGHEASFVGKPKVLIKLSENSVKTIKKALLWKD